MSNAQPSQEAFPAIFKDDRTHEQLNLHLTGKQLTRLRELAGGDVVMTQDALTSYLVLRLNPHCLNNKDECRILRTNTAINFRGVPDSIALALAGLSFNAA